MPHFAFWHWMRLPFINSLGNASAQISDIESSTSFANKIPKAVWRGTPWYGSPANTELRKNLLVVSRTPETNPGEGGTPLPWSDIESLIWESNGSKSPNALPIEDFCRYKYVVYTEGVTYSGRLQFHQLCESIMITPAISWLQHTTHLIRPVWSSELLAGDPDWEGPPPRLRGLAPGGGARKPDPHPSKRGLKLWPPGTTYPAEEANVVFVSPDWSDLEGVVTYLEDHPDVAAGIARRQRETFHGGGYFSPAAETCYWRAMMRGWAAVARKPTGERKDNEALNAGIKETEEADGFWEMEGTQWELWVLDNLLKPPTPKAAKYT